MPKPTRLHSKGKANSLQKPFKVDKDVTDGGDPEESLRQFQLELCWCIQQLERSLGEKKGNEKQLQEVWKVLTILKNNNQPIIRKRQLMRTHFGDYRAKMAAEEKKLAKMASKIKISEVQEKPKATFLRKSVFLTTGNESFRFNFNLAPEQEDNGNSNTQEPNNSNRNDSNNFNDCNTERSLIETNMDKNNEDKNVKQFKFACSSSEFKFNFDIDKP